MLVELAVRDLGVIAEARIPFAEGMTALTGETGAGKTMLVEALRLLCGQKADPATGPRRGGGGRGGGPLRRRGHRVGPSAGGAVLGSLPLLPQR